MKIVLAPNAFKGSLSAEEVCRAMEVGARRVFPAAEIVSIPLADGGAGTLDALTRDEGAIIKTQMVRGPLGAPVQAKWGILPDGHAVIEMAQASGLNLVQPKQRDALRSSTFGTGQIIKAALKAGCRQIWLGLGDSATCDGGLGALGALGLFARDANGKVLPDGGGSLADLADLDLRFLDERLGQTRFTLLCDVSNPLHGSRGSARNYAAQKGANPQEIVRLEWGLQHFADIAESALRGRWRDQPGAGAAGGLGFAMLAFCRAQYQSGGETILRATQCQSKIDGADLILTGEGQIDAQTLDGKTVAGIASLACERSIPIIGFGGRVRLNQQQIHDLGLHLAVSLSEEPAQESENSVLASTGQISDKVEQTLRSFLVRSS